MEVGKTEMMIEHLAYSTSQLNSCSKEIKGLLNAYPYPVNIYVLSYMCSGNVEKN